MSYKNHLRFQKAASDGVIPKCQGKDFNMGKPSNRQMTLDEIEVLGKKLSIGERKKSLAKAQFLEISTDLKYLFREWEDSHKSEFELLKNMLMNTKTIAEEIAEDHLFYRTQFEKGLITKKQYQEMLLILKATEDMEKNNA